jgi:recombination protein RecT
MSATDATRQALERRDNPPPTLLQLIERQQPAIERALPAAIGAERFTRIALTEVRRNPLLLECAPESVLGALMQSAQLGLEPGPLGHAYLVPYKRECTFIVGYKGMIELAYRSERVAAIEAHIVYEGEPFEYRQTQRGPVLNHEPLPPDERGAMVRVYAKALVRAGARSWMPVVHAMWPQEVEAARLRSQLGRQNKGPWHTDADAMTRKTAARRLSAFLPMTPLFAQALASDERVVREFDFEADAVVVEGDDSE